MMFKEIFDIYCENYVEHVSTICPQNAEFCYIITAGPRLSTQTLHIHTVDHLIFQCKRLQNEREILKSSELKVDKRPVSKSELINENMKQFIGYIN
jgi:hypothetical protein